MMHASESIESSLSVPEGFPVCPSITLEERVGSRKPTPSVGVRPES